jgi:hypothetical protein
MTKAKFQKYREHNSWLMPAGPGGLRSRPTEKYWAWSGVRTASWMQLRSYLLEQVAASVQKIENMVVGICCVDHATPYSAKLATNFADKQR